jgi:hypothetical protein
MKQLHLLSDALYQSLKYNIGTHHTIILPDGSHCMISDVTDDVRAQITSGGGTELPCLLNGEAVSADIVTALSSYGVVSTDNCFNVAVKLSQTHSAFKPHRL